MSVDVTHVVTLLTATFSESGNDAGRQHAEAQLKVMEKLQIWPTGLLSIMGEQSYPRAARLAAALALKRSTRDHWHYDEPKLGASPYPDEVKNAGAWFEAMPFFFFFFL